MNLQELELPEDMNLDDEGKGEQEEEGQQEDNQADQAQEQQQAQQGDAFTEKPDANDESVENPQAADQDDDMADDGSEEAAGEAAAGDESEAVGEGEEPDQDMEADAFEEGDEKGGEDDPMEGPMGGHEADEVEEQTQAQQPEAGPEGLAAATAAPATAQVPLQRLMGCCHHQINSSEHSSLLSRQQQMALLTLMSVNSKILACFGGRWLVLFILQFAFRVRECKVTPLNGALLLCGFRAKWEGSPAFLYQLTKACFARSTGNAVPVEMACSCLNVSSDEAGAGLHHLSCKRRHTTPVASLTVCESMLVIQSIAFVP